MATARVNLNAVSPSAAHKTKVQGIKSDASFSDVLNKENKASLTKSDSKEAKINKITSEKSFKGNDKMLAGSTDNKSANKPNDKTGDAVYKVKDGNYKADRNALKKLFTEETETGEETQDEKTKALMAILASMIAGISAKTETDETTVKDFIVESNLTSENLLDINSWKSFVTEINGLDNISAILTNDEAFKDLGVISDIINSHFDEVEQMTAGMTEGVTDEKRAGEELSDSEKKEVISLNEILAKMFEKQKRVELVVTRKEVDVEETIEQDVKDPVVIVPLTANAGDADSANTQAGFEQSSHNTHGENKEISAEVTGVSAHNLFDNIAENLQKLENTNSLPEGTSAKEILEQVTNQIKGLHAPDKTSIEFMLTPETLGKVAVNVSSKHGILQAEFRVESSEAKVALESRMAELKLNFENQGLKVASVSVTISENGIGRDDRGRNSGEEGKHNKRNRNFSLEAEEGIEGISVSSEDAIISYTDNGTGSNINLGA